jgi:transcriptional antiterminator NusG
MSDIDTNDPTDDTVIADPASADDGVSTDDNEPDDVAVETETTAADVAADDGVPTDDEPDDVAVETETTAADVAADDGVPTDDEPDDVAVETETTAADVAADDAPGADDEAQADVDVVTDDELLEQSVVVDNPFTRPGRWFVVHTQSGYEKKVKQNLEARIHSMNAEEAVYEVVIPMEDYVDFKNGKRVVNQRKMFPGYLLVRAELDDTAWFVIRNTPGVTGFVGQGAKPSPLPRRDVEAFLMPKGGEEQVATRAKPRLEYEMGETVRVKEGPFADFSGEVIELNEDQLKLKVLVNIFGRETPVELEFSKVAKL